MMRFLITNTSYLMISQKLDKTVKFPAIICIALLIWMNKNMIGPWNISVCLVQYNDWEWWAIQQVSFIIKFKLENTMTM